MYFETTSFPFQLINYTLNNALNYETFMGLLINFNERKTAS